MVIKEQTQIGRHQLLLGYMSKKMLMLSSMDTSRTGYLTLAAGWSRMHSALKAMTLVTRTWAWKNQVLHQHKDDKDQEIYSMESAELRHYHSNPKLLQSSDQHYHNNMTLNKLLQSHPSVRRRWQKTSWHQGQLTCKRWTEPTNNEQIHDTHSADKRHAQCARDKTDATNTSWTTAKTQTQHSNGWQHSSLVDLQISNKNSPKILSPPSLERCQGWVPSESLKKFILEVNQSN